MGFIKREKKVFVSISAGGELRIPATENTPGAQRREFTERDGVKQVKYEIVQDAYEGFIKDVKFNDAGFGLMINITFERENSNDDEVIISTGADTNFGTDIMKKLPNVDFSKRVTLSPFSFISDDNKDVRGVSFLQVGTVNGKVKSFFYDEANKRNINGFPSPMGDTSSYDKDDWKIYFMQVRKFLVAFTEQNVIPVVNTAAFSRNSFGQAEIQTQSVMQQATVNVQQEQPAIQQQQQVAQQQQPAQAVSISNENPEVAKQRVMQAFGISNQPPVQMPTTQSVQPTQPNVSNTESGDLNITTIPF